MPEARESVSEGALTVFVDIGIEWLQSPNPRPDRQ